LSNFLKIFSKQTIALVISLFFLNSTAQVTYESAFPNIDFDFPVELQSPLDGTDRMFVVE